MHGIYIVKNSYIPCMHAWYTYIYIVHACACMHACNIAIYVYIHACIRKYVYTYCIFFYFLESLHGRYITFSLTFLNPSPVHVYIIYIQYISYNIVHLKGQRLSLCSTIGNIYTYIYIYTVSVL